MEAKAHFPPFDTVGNANSKRPPDKVRNWFSEETWQAVPRHYVIQVNDQVYINKTYLKVI